MKLLLTWNLNYDIFSISLEFEPLKFLLPALESKVFLRFRINHEIFQLLLESKLENVGCFGIYKKNLFS
jgi:hypothetical protein